MQMKKTHVPCIHAHKCAMYILNANEKHEYSALYTYLMQMKNMSTVPCIHTYCK